MIVKTVKFKNLDMNAVKRFLEQHPETQLFSAKCFHGEKHVLHCVNECLKAFASDENIAKTKQVEFLLFLTGTRQIKKALQKATPEEQSIFTAWGKHAARDFEELRKQFSITIKPLPRVGKEEQLRAIERSSLFKLSS